MRRAPGCLYTKQALCAGAMPRMPAKEFTKYWLYLPLQGTLVVLTSTIGAMRHSQCTFLPSTRPGTRLGHTQHTHTHTLGRGFIVLQHIVTLPGVYVPPANANSGEVIGEEILYYSLEKRLMINFAQVATMMIYHFQSSSVQPWMNAVWLQR